MIRILIFAFASILLIPAWSAVRFFLLHRLGIENEILLSSLTAAKVIYTFLSLSLFTVATIVFAFSMRRGKWEKMIISLIFALCAYSTVVFLDALINWGTSFYNNFLYSNYGLQVGDLRLLKNSLTIFSLVFVLSSIKEYLTIKKLSVSGLNSNSITVVFIAGVLIFGYKATYPFANSISLLNSTKQTYEQKIGRDYQYIDALANNTPEESNIILPPQGGLWPAVGNQPVARYFLYPRTLYGGDYISSNPEDLEKMRSAYFVEIALADSRPVWPEILQNDKKISFGNDQVYFSYSDLVHVSNLDNISIYFVEF